MKNNISIPRERRCDNCGEKVVPINSDEWYDENGCFCSEECKYEFEIGNPGEEY